MKGVIPLLGLCVFFGGCGKTQIDPATPVTIHLKAEKWNLLPESSLSERDTGYLPRGSAPPASSNVYDMLKWMTMSPQLRAGYHMAGNANPVYTSVLPDRFFWTKSKQGYPWDVKLYDAQFIYTWATELNWSDPSSYKAFHSPTLGNYNLPLVPRYAKGGYPGSTIRISDSTYEIHTNCTSYATKNLGYVVNQVWGPYSESFGGDLPSSLQTLIISYRYSCDATYSNCKHKEEYHLAKPYGLVYWQHQILQTNGAYAPPDNATLLNKLIPGQTSVITTCF